MELAKTDLAALPESERNILTLAGARLLMATAAPHTFEAVTAVFVDLTVGLAGAVECTGHEGIVLGCVAEHHQLCRADALAVGGQLAGIFPPLQHGLEQLCRSTDRYDPKDPFGQNLRSAKGG